MFKLTEILEKFDVIETIHPSIVVAIIVLTTLLWFVRSPLNEMSKKISRELSNKIIKTTYGVVGIAVLILISSILISSIVFLVLTRNYDQENDWMCTQSKKQLHTRHKKGWSTASAPYFMKRRVTKEDLQGKGKSELVLMRNEIYARHGRGFDRKNLRDHFCAQSWYNPRYPPDNFPSEMLTEIQQDNAICMLSYQKNGTWCNQIQEISSYEKGKE